MDSTLLRPAMVHLLTFINASKTKTHLTTQKYLRLRHTAGSPVQESNWRVKMSKTMRESEIVEASQRPSLLRVNIAQWEHRGASSQYTTCAMWPILLLILFSRS